jgi:hypothetical protein
MAHDSRIDTRLEAAAPTQPRTGALGCAARAVAGLALAAGVLGAAVAAQGATSPATARAPSAAPSTAPLVGATSMTEAQALATEAFRSRRYADAYGRYAALADRGDPTAAWMALSMVTNGPVLYGSEWSATPGQLRRWNALATRHAERSAAQIAAHDRGE